VELAHDPRFLTVSFKDWEADAALWQLASKWPADERKLRVERLLREDIYPRALITAHEERQRPREIRLGERRWVKNARGVRWPFKPAVLALDQYHDWLRQEARNIAKELLLEQAGADQVVAPPERVFEPAPDSPDMPASGYVDTFPDASTPESILLACEVIAEEEHLATPAPQLRPQDEELLALRAAGYTSAQIGEMLGGSTANAIDVRFSRLRNRRHRP
jgi:hypothetical protein